MPSMETAALVVHKGLVPSLLERMLFEYLPTAQVAVLALSEAILLCPPQGRLRGGILCTASRIVACCRCCRRAQHARFALQRPGCRPRRLRRPILRRLVQLCRHAPTACAHASLCSLLGRTRPRWIDGRRVQDRLYLWSLHNRDAGSIGKACVT